MGPNSRPSILRRQNTVQMYGSVPLQEITHRGLTEMKALGAERERQDTEL